MSVKNSSWKEKSGQDQILEVKIGWDFVFLLKRWYQAVSNHVHYYFLQICPSNWKTQRRVSPNLSTDTLSPAWLHVGRHREGSHPSCPLIYYITSLLIFHWLRLRLDISNRANTPTLTFVGCLVSGISPPKSY